MSTLFVAGGVFAQQKTGKDGVYEELNFFDEAFERIRQDAVDSVSDTKLIGAAISGMLSGLDPQLVLSRRGRVQGDADPGERQNRPASAWW